MSSKKRKNYNKKEATKKKILDGIDVPVTSDNKEEVKDFNKVIEDIRQDVRDEEFKKGKQEQVEEVKKADINDQIQSAVSILFTIVIFALILVLIFVLYNNFLKKDEETPKEEVCSEYIKKDYDINIDDVREFIIDNRYIIYNINEFDNTKIDTNTINNFSKFIIWNSDSEYSECVDNEYCLDTKKEIDYNTLKNELLKFFDLNSLNLVFDYNFTDDDTTRLFLNNDKVILTFKNMEYETFKHDIVDIRVDEDNIYIIFALSKRFNESNFSYVGSKKLNLLYKDNKFVIKSIETSVK